MAGKKNAKDLPKVPGVSPGTDPARFMTPILVDPREDTPERRRWRKAVRAAFDAADRGDYGPGIRLGIFPADRA